MNIRQAKSFDVDAIYDLIQIHSRELSMLPKSKYKICSRLQGFVVCEDDKKKIIGCGSLFILWHDLAEIQSLAIANEYQRQGIGKKIVYKLIQNAKTLAIPKIITLTYQIEFFKKLGFQKIGKDQFPRKIWGECLDCPKLEVCDEIAMIYVD